METKKTALVIGGSRGVGLQIAQEGLLRGMKTIVVARDLSKIPKILQEKVVGIQADISSPMHFEHTIQAMMQDADHVFWVAGAYVRGKVWDTSDERVEWAVAMHQTIMVKFLKDFIRQRSFLAAGAKEEPKPFTFSVVGSTSSFQMKQYEAIYAMAKAGQAAFLRQFAPELAEELPGSRVVLANSGRIASQADVPQKDSGGWRINPETIARCIWDELMRDSSDAYREMNFFRGDSKGCHKFVGTVKPEIP